MNYNEARAAGLFVEYRAVGISSWDDERTVDRYDDEEERVEEDDDETT